MAGTWVREYTTDTRVLKENSRGLHWVVREESGEEASDVLSTMAIDTALQLQFPVLGALLRRRQRYQPLLHGPCMETLIEMLSVH